jgi:hypothetical protein
MLSFFKNLFGAKPAETVAEVPYKVEQPTLAVTETVVVSKPTAAPKKPRSPAKKPAARKPKASK